MASIVSVEQLKGLASGSTPNTISIPAGQTLSIADKLAYSNMPVGTVIQKVRKVVDQSAHANTSSSSYVDIANSAISITPKFNNSIILFSCSIYTHAQTGSPQFDFTLFRDSIDVSSSYSASKHGTYGPGADASDNIYDRFNALMSDTPNTTNSITYSIRFRRVSGSNDLYIHSNGINEFYLEEIAQ